MGMAGWGTPRWTEVMRDVLVDNPEQLRFRSNLHTGLDSNFLDSVLDNAVVVVAKSVSSIIVDAINYSF
jgi:hypothetical protein